MTEKEHLKKEEKLLIAVRLLRINEQLRSIAMRADEGTMNVAEVLEELRKIQLALTAIDPELTISNLEDYQTSLFDNKTDESKQSD